MNTPLKKLRESKGLSQSEVAAAVGLSQSGYHRIETPLTSQASAENAEKIARCKFFRRLITEEMILYPERFKKFKVAPE